MEDGELIDMTVTSTSTSTTSVIDNHATMNGNSGGNVINTTTDPTTYSNNMDANTNTNNNKDTKQTPTSTPTVARDESQPPSVHEARKNVINDGSDQGIKSGTRKSRIWKTAPVSMMSDLKNNRGKHQGKIDHGNLLVGNDNDNDNDEEIDIDNEYEVENVNDNHNHGSRNTSIIDDRDDLIGNLDAWDDSVLVAAWENAVAKEQEARQTATATANGNGLSQSQLRRQRKAQKRQLQQHQQQNKNKQQKTSQPHHPAQSQPQHTTSSISPNTTPATPSTLPSKAELFLQAISWLNQEAAVDATEESDRNHTVDSNSMDGVPVTTTNAHTHLQSSPPPLPYTGSAVEDEALHNLINAWYCTGYYTGVYQMMKQQQQQNQPPQFQATHQHANHVSQQQQQANETTAQLCREQQTKVS